MTRAFLIPEDFKGSVYQGYANKLIKQNYWKFSRTIGTFEDAQAEAALVYFETKQYAGKIAKNPKHFMSLYKKNLHFCFTDWSNYDSKQRQLLHDISKEPSILELNLKQKNPKKDLNLIFNKGSKELREVINIILNSSTEILDIFKQDLKIGLDCFLKKSVEYCNIPLEKAPILEEELRTLLS